MNIELKQVITQIIAFLIMLWILKRYTWQPLLSILDERTAKIKASFKEAEQHMVQAEKYRIEYQRKIDDVKNEAQSIIQGAVQEARKIAVDIQQDAQSKANEILTKAQEQAERDKTKGHEQLKKEMIEASCVAFEKLAHLKMTQEERDRLGLELMKEAL